ncbi:hypothetical protein OKW41_004852 [Paraburkholderia sp. UCT70]
MTVAPLGFNRWRAHPEVKFSSKPRRVKMKSQWRQRRIGFLETMHWAYCACASTMTATHRKAWTRTTVMMTWSRPATNRMAVARLARTLVRPFVGIAWIPGLSITNQQHT